MIYGINLVSPGYKRSPPGGQQPVPGRRFFAAAVNGLAQNDIQICSPDNKTNYEL
jgi:hypothetical protein